MKNCKQNILIYRIAQVASFFVATLIFKRRILRNEIKGKKGPFVVIANHQAALDFVNLIGVTHVPMHFVISDSFYNSLPIKRILDRMGLIPKQQFQTTMKDMKKMKAVIDAGNPLVIYPAGLMCEDGLSTPIPTATYKFLKWLKADVYMAKTCGTYFSMPKWARGMRPGRTYLDVYRLFTKEQLEVMDMETVQAKTDEALLFDAYREQEEHLVPYKNNHVVEGLEQVLYMCPHCKTEFSVEVKNRNTLYCTRCGFEQVSDRHAFLHNHKGVGDEIRYVSDWSRLIYEDLKEKIRLGLEKELTSHVCIHMIDPKKNKFLEVGQGTICLNREGFHIVGIINGENVDTTVSIASFASLPFSPGRHLEIQQGDIIYRCLPQDGKLVMKFINMVKIFYELNQSAVEAALT